MSSAEEEEFEIPVRDSRSETENAAPVTRAPEESAPVTRGDSAETDDAPDWTRTQSVRDDPESLGDEARKLLNAVRAQFVEPLLRNYPEAAGHLSTAGAELASAVRSLIRGSEQLWAGPGARAEDPAGQADVVVIEEHDDEASEGAAEHPTEG